MKRVAITIAVLLALLLGVAVLRHQRSRSTKVVTEGERVEWSKPVSSASSAALWSVPYDRGAPVAAADANDVFVITDLGQDHRPPATLTRIPRHGGPPVPMEGDFGDFITNMVVAEGWLWGWKTQISGTEIFRVPRTGRRAERLLSVGHVNGFATDGGEAFVVDDHAHLTRLGSNGASDFANLERPTGPQGSIFEVAIFVRPQVVEVVTDKAMGTSTVRAFDRKTGKTLHEHVIDVSTHGIASDDDHWYGYRRSAGDDDVASVVRIAHDGTEKKVLVASADSSLESPLAVQNGRLVYRSHTDLQITSVPVVGGAATAVFRREDGNPGSFFHIDAAGLLSFEPRDHRLAIVAHDLP